MYGQRRLASKTYIGKLTPPEEIEKLIAIMNHEQREWRLKKNLADAKAEADDYCGCVLPDQSCAYCRKVSEAKAALTGLVVDELTETLPYYKGT
jgi:hypothetical protein